MLVKTVTGVLLLRVLPNHLTVVLSLPRKGIPFPWQRIEQWCT